MVIAPIEQRDVDGRAPQRLGGGQPAEPSAHDDDARHDLEDTGLVGQSSACRAGKAVPFIRQKRGLSPFLSQGPELAPYWPPISRRPAHPAGAGDVSRAAVTAARQASAGASPFASSAWNDASTASSTNASDGQRATISVETPPAAAAHASVSMAPLTPEAPNVDASSSTSTRARPDKLNHSRASQRRSFGAASGAPARSTDVKRGVAPLTCSGAETCTTSAASISARSDGPVASDPVLTVAAAAYGFAFSCARAWAAAASGSFHPGCVTASCDRIEAGICGAEVKPPPTRPGPGGGAADRRAPRPEA